MSKKPLNTKATSVTEHCQNPFKPECRSTDIDCYIIYKGEKRAICYSCWDDLVEKKWISNSKKGEG